MGKNKHTSFLFSDLIFEAVVTDVSYEKGTCSINPLSVNLNSIIDDIPLPVMAGNGNAGIFCPLTRGTSVIAAHTSGRGRTATAIISTVIKSELLPGNFDTGKGLDVPVGTTSNPEIVDGRVILRGGGGSQVSCYENGDVFINTLGGSGIFFRRLDSRASYTLVAQDQVLFSDGGKSVFGPVRRISGLVRSLNPREDRAQVPLHADTKYATKTDPIGFFLKSLPLQRSYNKRKRNPALAEYRLVINEFCTDSQFTGFDDEELRVTGDIKTYDYSDTFIRNRELGNTLHLAEHELIEIIGGNVVDLNGNILDINYNSLSYGGNRNTVPKSDLRKAYDRARRISRRGIGYHFQLTTNTRSNDPSNSVSNFVFDIDKEGLLKVNIPASTNTGNIPFVSNATFASKSSDEVAVEFLNISETEPVPVTLRDGLGVVKFPNEDHQGITERKTGIRYDNSGANPYFPSVGNTGAVSAPIRINPTRYHNMYSAAERLLANRIEFLNIAEPPDDGKVQGSPVLDPFEIPIPEGLGEAEEAAGLPNSLKPGSDPIWPTYMSVVGVRPAKKPAIYTGGDTLVGGIFYDDSGNPPLSNSFTSVENEDSKDSTLGVKIVDESGEILPLEKVAVGGKSAHLTLGGSVEASIGADDVDRKSILLDTEGGVIAWLGSDNSKPGRSLVMQTDGEMLINVGGSYQNDDPDSPTMNVGRFELRVNVVDKGHVGAEFVVSEEADEVADEGGNPFKESDFIISISENGIVIAGNKFNAPMIIRNEDRLILESSSDVIIKSGADIKFIGGDGRTKTLASMGRT